MSKGISQRSLRIGLVAITLVLISSFAFAAPTLGYYPNTMVGLGGNKTVTPDVAPTGATSINVATNSNFKGTFVANPVTGVVRVTNAHPAGTYTVTVKAFKAPDMTSRTFTDTTGVGLVEAYDLAPGSNSRLANISTRGFVETGDNVMIGGFIVGNGLTKVIVRAIGPSLPVPGALQDPTLELHDGNGATFASNDNWRTGGQETEIIATTIPPPNDLESAIVRTLAPGNYTAIVRGKNNTTGVGLVEVYNLQ